MRLASFRYQGEEKAGILVPGGILPLELLNRKFGWKVPNDLLGLIETGSLEIDQRLVSGRRGEGSFGPQGTSSSPKKRFPSSPLYRRPRKIWGIGLNYQAHAQDLSEKAPETEPASFLKPDTTIIGHGDTILIPRQSEKTTAEAELGIVIGRRCKNVAREDWLSVVAGFTTVLDMTAEDILRRNPRYLTRAKSFDYLFQFRSGPGDSR